MDEEVAIEDEGERSGADRPETREQEAAPAELVARVRRAEEQVRLLEREKLIGLKEAADARRELDDELVRLRQELAETQERVVELERERDETRETLEKFLRENWNELKEATPADGVPLGLAELLASAEAEDREREQPASPAGGSRRPTPASEPAAPAAEDLPEPTDVDSLIALLAAGATLETTPAFARFQPVKTSHIKVSDWLQRAHDLPALENLARNELSQQELHAVLFLFLQKEFIRLQRG
ncbi:MAG: hypothetical protein R3190_11440 [Thermoanaerobaculia bacterium]|nr:hypothetical protein [Thermoanaerobaculia bacterium]